MSENGKEQFSTDFIDYSDSKLANFDEAILLTGYGRYNTKLLLVCGIIMTSVALQFGISAYIIPSAECELELSSSQMGLLNAGFMIGCATGGVISGTIADTIGRKNVLIWSALIDGCVTIISGLSQNFPTLFLFRCISGLIIGGPSGIIFTYLGEFHAGKSKTKVLCYLGFFFVLSWVLLPALAWIIIPLEFNIVIFGLVFNSWRLFLGVSGLPSLLGTYLLSNYPESPRFLLSQGENTKVLQIMREMFVSNTKLEVDDYPVKRLVSDCLMTSKSINSPSVIVKNIWVKFRRISSPPVRNYIILSSFILFTNMAGFYGLGLWLPELSNRFQIHHKLHPNVTTTVCELAYNRNGEKNEFQSNSKTLEYLNPKQNFTFQIISDQVSSTTTAQPSIRCNSSIDGQVFIDTMIIGCCCLFGTLATAQLVNFFNRKVLLMITMLIPGVCGCAIYFLTTATQNLIVTCIFSAFISMSNVVIFSLLVDMFPTNINTVAISVVLLIGRLGAVLTNIVFGLLLEISCEIPIFSVGGIIIAGGLVAFLIPKNQTLLPKIVGNE